ncbi:hypothetical protein ASE82_16920 [Sphingomonas sp. Leaf230]|nr:hypothetical protein ASE82_16920 [Sphingomonas sp. Leaf230]
MDPRTIFCKTFYNRQIRTATNNNHFKIWNPTANVVSRGREEGHTFVWIYSANKNSNMFAVKAKILLYR